MSAWWGWAAGSIPKAVVPFLELPTPAFNQVPRGARETPRITPVLWLRTLRLREGEGLVPSPAPPVPRPHSAARGTPAIAVVLREDAGLMRPLRASGAVPPCRDGDSEVQGAGTRQPVNFTVSQIRGSHLWSPCLLCAEQVLSPLLHHSSPARKT